MSTVGTVYNNISDSCCAKVVKAVADVNSQVNVQQPTGALQAITSPVNKGTWELDIDPNKVRPGDASGFKKIYTKDLKRDCNQDTTADAVCSAADFSNVNNPEDDYAFADHTVELSIKREIVLSLEDFKKMCINPSQYIADKIRAFRPGVHEELNKKITSRLIAYMGAYSGQVDPNNSITSGQEKNVSFLVPNNAGGFMFDPTGYSLMKDEYAKLGWTIGQPLVVGGSQLSTFQTNSTFMGGTNVNGVTKTGVPGLYVDYGIDTAFGDGKQHLLTWMPGQVALQGYNEITDDMIKISIKNSRERMRITSPFGDGLIWDFYYDVDPGGCVYKLKWQVWFDVILPVPYADCVKKPLLHFLTGCDGNACPDSGSGSVEEGGGGIG